MRWIALLVGGLFLSYALQALFKGTVYDRQLNWVTRQQAPGAYWFQVLLYLVLGILGITYFLTA